MDDWWWSSASDLGSAVVSAAVLYVALIAATRISGLRTYSKMSGFDFPLTVAVGSLVASTVLMPDPPVVRGVVVLGTIFLLQAAVARLRSRFRRVRGVVDNQPIVLVRHGRVLEDNMAKARVSMPELRAKLRSVNVPHVERVHAVVLETTGDVSVLHSKAGEDPDDWIMEGVRGWRAPADAPERR